MIAYGRAGFFLVFVLVFFWNHVCISGGDGVELSPTMVQMKTVKDRILSGYDKNIRPTEIESNTTKIRTAFIPRQILDVDEEKGVLILDSYFYMIWHDPRLVWNFTTEYNGYIPLPTDTLWVPDISMYNSHSTQVDPVKEVKLTIGSDGTVYWGPPIHTQTTCTAFMDVTYPNDIVTCIIIMGSWVHDGWEVDFSHGDELHLDQFVNINPRWEFLPADSKVIRNVTFYEGYEEPYVSLQVYIPLKRRSPPEIETTRNPCILVMLLTLSIFWLPTNSSKKVILGGILFLVLTILLVYVAWSTKYPLGAVIAVSFLQTTMYIVVTTLLLQILVIFNLCNISGPVRPPLAVMLLLTGPLGKYACLRTSFSHDNIPIDKITLKEDIPNTIESATPKEDWMLFAAGLDRIFFLMMSIAMIAVHHL